jgi:acyl-CoA synthetase (AMP-forming)/AMP-acid ligase II
MIFRSRYPDITIPEVPLTQLVLRHAERLVDKPAFIDAASRRTLTYGQLVHDIGRAAAGLKRRGFGKGDVLAILSPNVPEYAVAFHAVATLGGICTTINPLYTPDEIRRQLEDSRARFLLTIPPLLANAQAGAQATRVESVYVFGEAPGAIPFAELLDSDSSVSQVPVDARNDLLVLPYSSGTTGMAKGVMITPRAIAANLRQVEEVGFFEESDVVISVLPFFHIYGMTLTLNAGPYFGSTVVTMARFEFEPFLAALQAFRVTCAPLVPPIVLALAKHPLVERYDLSSLRVIFCGAAPLGGQLQRACEERLKVPVRQGYGMTELAGASYVSSEEVMKTGSVGAAVPSCETRVVDIDSGQDRGPGAEGELWIRTPSMMSGYLNKPDATAATLTSDGWLKTGDIGYVDDDGFVFVVDRLKELIKYNAYQVAPAELEAVLVTHPAVADAAVIASPDEECGEVPKAFVVLKGQATSDEVMAYVAARVAPYKKIRRLEFIDAIPKSASGKILRRVLIERERAARSSS